MLRIEIPDAELFDEARQEFVAAKGGTLELEHSLVSLSKWESKWRKPFLSKERKTQEQTIDYVRCMAAGGELPPAAELSMPAAIFREIGEYVNAPMTATWFAETPGAARGSEVITAELIYYSMIQHGIPAQFESWHLNRLLTLIRVCNVKSAPKKKMGKKDMLARRRALNSERLAGLNGRG